MKVLLSLKDKKQRFRLYDRDSKVVPPFEIDDYNYEQENEKDRKSKPFRIDSSFYYIRDIDENDKCKKEFLPTFDYENETYCFDNNQSVNIIFRLIRDDCKDTMVMSVIDEKFMKSIFENPQPKIMINVLKKMLMDYIEHIENMKQLILDDLEWYSL